MAPFSKQSHDDILLPGATLQYSLLAPLTISTGPIGGEAQNFAPIFLDVVNIKTTALLLLTIKTVHSIQHVRSKSNVPACGLCMVIQDTRQVLLLLSQLRWLPKRLMYRNSFHATFWKQSSCPRYSHKDCSCLQSMEPCQQANLSVHIDDVSGKFAIRGIRNSDRSRFRAVLCEVVS